MKRPRRSATLWRPPSTPCRCRNATSSRPSTPLHRAFLPPPWTAPRRCSALRTTSAPTRSRSSRLSSTTRTPASPLGRALVGDGVQGAARRSGRGEDGRGGPRAGAGRDDDGPGWRKRRGGGDGRGGGEEEATTSSSSGGLLPRRRQRSRGRSRSELLQRALTAYSACAELHPLYAEAHNAKATALYVAGDPVASLRACEVVLDLNPHHFSCAAGERRSFFSFSNSGFFLLLFFS